jgi:hypothetical protein
MYLGKKDCSYRTGVMLYFCRSLDYIAKELPRCGRSQ